MNETVVDTEEVMPVIVVGIIFMNLSQSLWLRNTKNVHRNEEC